jgi:hypothetical protein
MPNDQEGDNCSFSTRSAWKWRELGGVLLQRGRPGQDGRDLGGSCRRPP